MPLHRFSKKLSHLTCVARKRLRRAAFTTPLVCDAMRNAFAVRRANTTLRRDDEQHAQEKHARVIGAASVVQTQERALRQPGARFIDETSSAHGTAWEQIHDERLGVRSPRIGARARTKAADPGVRRSSHEGVSQLIVGRQRPPRILDFVEAREVAIHAVDADARAAVDRAAASVDDGDVRRLAQR